MGPSVMTATILGSSLNEHFELRHFDTTLNRKLEGIGRIGLSKALQLWKQYRRFSKALKNERPALVLIPLSQTTAGLIKDLRFVRIAHKAGVRILLQLHGGELDRTLKKSSPTLRSYAEATLRLSHGAIVLGDGLRHIFRPYLSEERIFTIPNGLDIPHPETSPPDPPPFRILFLSNLIRRKGVEDTIEAAEVLWKKGYMIHLDVAGEWFEASLEKKCKEYVGSKKLPVRFHPPLGIKDKEELLQQAHLFLLPSREPEGLPVALIEALGHGLSIITTAQGAIPDTTTDGWNGFTVLPRDPVSIAERVEELITDPRKRSLFGARSRQRYEEQFTEERLCDNLYHCFKTLLEQPL